MRDIKEIWIAIQSYGKAWKWLFHKKIWYYLLIPLVLNIFLLFGGYSLLSNFADNTTQYFIELSGAKHWTFWGSEYFDTILSGILHTLLKALFFLFMIFYGGFIVIMIMSPFFSLLSEQVEALETGISYPFSWKKLFQDILRGVGIALRNSLLQLFISVIILLIAFIPFLGILSPLLLFIISSYFYGCSFMDFAMERRYASIRESVKFLKKHRAAAFVNGSIFALSLMLPFCNLFLAAFAAIWAVIAGTITLLRIDEENTIILKKGKH